VLNQFFFSIHTITYGEEHNRNSFGKKNQTIIEQGNPSNGNEIASYGKEIASRCETSIGSIYIMYRYTKTKSMERKVNFSMFFLDDMLWISKRKNQS
jgi:hypothetical protein